MKRSFLSSLKFLSILLAFGLSLACSSQSGQENRNNAKFITLSITFQDPQKGIVKLSKFSSQSQDYAEIDKANINGKSLQFNVDVSHSEFYQLDFFAKHKVVLVLDSSDVAVEVKSVDGIFSEEVQGSPGTQYYREAGEIVQEFQKEIMLLRQENVDVQDTGTVRQDIETRYAALHQKSIGKLKAFIEKIIPNIVAVRALGILDAQEEIEFYRHVANRMQAEAPNLPYTQQLQEQLVILEEQVALAKRTAIGASAPNLSLPSPEGKVLQLQDLQGKLVLLDFWASWCKPCRIENPRVVKIYQKYQGEGFEILGVSLDQNRDAWLKAIQDDGLTWLHVLDAPNESSQALQLYNVNAIPSTFLISPEGSIVAKNLRGDALEKKIQEELKRGNL